MASLYLAWRAFFTFLWAARAGSPLLKGAAPWILINLVVLVESAWLHQLSLPGETELLFLLALQVSRPIILPPLSGHHWTYDHISVVPLRHAVRSEWSWHSGNGWWLLNSWLHFPLLKETVPTGHKIRHASHIQQFHQGEKRGTFAQLVSTPEQNVVRHYLTLRNLTGFKAELWSDFVTDDTKAL